MVLSGGVQTCRVVGENMCCTSLYTRFSSPRAIGGGVCGHKAVVWMGRDLRPLQGDSAVGGHGRYRVTDSEALLKFAKAVMYWQKASGRCCGAGEKRGPSGSE